MFEPSYDSYAACASMAGAVPRLVRLHAPDWSFDPDELAAAIGPRTRLILLNSPHNPTGQGLRPGRAGADRRAVLRPRPPGGDRRGLRAPRLRRRPRSPGHPARDGRAHALHLLGRQDLLLHRMEGGLGRRGPAPLVAAVRAAKQFLTYTSGAPFQLAIAHGLALRARR